MDLGKNRGFEFGFLDEPGVGSSHQMRQHMLQTYYVTGSGAARRVTFYTTTRRSICTGSSHVNIMTVQCKKTRSAM